MTPKPTSTTSESRTGFELYIGIAATLLTVAVSAIISNINIRTLEANRVRITSTHDVISALNELLSIVKDAETGQRGFLLTEDEVYMTPYHAAVAKIPDRLHELEKLTQSEVTQTARLESLRHHLNVKLDELRNTINLHESQNRTAALDIVKSNQGKLTMDEIRNIVGQMVQHERQVRNRLIDEVARAYRTALSSGVLSALVGLVMICTVGVMVRRSIQMRQRHDWVQSGQIGLSHAMLGEQSIHQVAENVLNHLSEYVDARAGALYVKDGSFRRAATYGVPAQSTIPESFDLSDGLLGLAAKSGHTITLNDVPDGYLVLGSALGRGKPKHLAVAPLKEDGSVIGVLELGLMRPVDATMKELLEKASESIGVAIRSAKYRDHVQKLLHETQQQAEELQTQGEELRVSNEELEEQGRALKESQARLEMQQAELEQTNSQLEQQAEILERQRDAASRAKKALEVQAHELEQSSRYKSDFLANMSHELRTPLNSSLILAKLLADNRDGNLTAEQVRYAETIRTAGNDLLALINDILDLSKIEAGHMEIRSEQVRIAKLVEELERGFQPIANEKGLAFHHRLASGCPEMLVTDRQRLEQILKNLISNALKFTSSGEVSLEIGPSNDGRVAFQVRDTGIGIPEHQQSVIFEAFRQADGTTNRKYGGTGLGLSIAKELARLLGGEIQLQSKPGTGSIFTVLLPQVLDLMFQSEHASNHNAAPQTPDRGSVDSARSSPPNRTLNLTNGDRPPPQTHAELAVSPLSQPVAHAADDRDHLTGHQRVVLVVEDDEDFARIIYDLAHETGFQCLIASTAEEGLAVAIKHRPNAVVLDVGLPDYSGLSVLDRLKQDDRTRHIPVHVISGHDHSETALALGAVGYMLKPVKREELSQTLAQLEAKLDQRMHRVLIVEDDPVQLDSLGKLLSAHDVETIGVRTAAECLEHLKHATFDCMVLDLSLPDTTGHELLETLSQQENHSFPPVIVYTGRDLSHREELDLRKYSKSIIIKGAKSPERLLDEVTLFLHQVVSELPAEQQQMLARAKNRDAALENRCILVVEDDVRNVFALTSVLEPRGARVQIARNGREALEALDQSLKHPGQAINLVLMDIMMPEMDGLTAIREIRKQPRWRKLPIIALTAKAMKNDQEDCLSAGANDYLAKPLDVEKLLSLVRVWMPRS